MSSVNLAILVGNLGGDPELKYTQSGKPWANFSIATSEKWTDQSGQPQEKTEWHRITVWGKQAENCKRYIGKGSKVYIEGRMSTRSWEDNEGRKHSVTEVIAEKVNFLSSSKRSDEQNMQHGYTG